mgnify:CR=1 FL=1
MTSPDLIYANLAHTRERIASAAGRAGRNPEDVLLVAVTKTVGVEEARTLFEAGAADLGENRVQEGLRKRETLADLPIHWHMIGRLQTNKVNKVVKRFLWIHSVDRLKLAEAISRSAVAAECEMNVLLQVNTSGESSKAGFAPEGLGEALPRLSELPGLRVCGLMTMAPLLDDPERTRPCFRRLRELRDEHAPRYPELIHLSMGMTQDFEIAIEEGATMVRIGTALFREAGHA